MPASVSVVPGADAAAAYLARRLTAGAGDAAALTRLDAAVGSVVVWILVLALPPGLLGRAHADTAGLVLFALGIVGLVWAVRALRAAGLSRPVAFYRGGLLILLGVAPLTLLGVVVSSAGEELTVGIIGLGAAAIGGVLYPLHLLLTAPADHAGGELERP